MSINSGLDGLGPGGARSAALSAGELARTRGPATDPAVFQADTEEQRSFLRAHKDVLVYAPRENSERFASRVRSAFNKCPFVVRVILVIMAIILLVCLLPLVIWVTYSTFRHQTIETISLGILMVVVYAVWAGLVRDI